MTSTTKSSVVYLTFPMKYERNIICARLLIILFLSYISRVVSNEAHNNLEEEQHLAQFDHRITNPPLAVVVAADLFLVPFVYS